MGVGSNNDSNDFLAKLRESERTTQTPKNTELSSASDRPVAL